MLWFFNRFSAFGFVDLQVGDTEAVKAAKAAADKASAAASKVGEAASNVTENKHELGEKKGYFKVP